MNSIGTKRAFAIVAWGRELGLVGDTRYFLPKPIMDYERRSIDLLAVYRCLARVLRAVLLALASVITAACGAIRSIARFTLMPTKVRASWRPAPVVGFSRRCSLAVVDGLLIVVPLALLFARLW